MNKKLLLPITILIIWIGFSGVIAATMDTFTVGYTEENLTFTGNQNITRILSLNKYVTVTEAYVNVSGFGVDGINGVLKWRYYNASEHTVSSPVIKDGVLYIGGQTNLTAINVTEGNIIWRSDTTGAIVGSAVVGSQYVYVGKENSQISAINITNGSQKWSKAAGGTVSGGLKLRNDYLYFGNGPGRKIYAINATNSSDIWSFTSSGASAGFRYITPAIEGDMLYAGEDGAYGYVYGLNATNGSKLWNRSLGFTATGNGIYAGVTVEDGVVYAIDTHRKVIGALNATNGSLIWNVSTTDVSESIPSVAYGMVYFGTKGTDDKVYALDTGTGSKVWEYQAGGDVRSSALIVDDMVIIGSDNNEIYVLNATNGSKIWNYTIASTSGYSSPAVSNGTIFAGGYGGVYAIDLGIASGNNDWISIKGNNNNTGYSKNIITSYPYNAWLEVGNVDGVREWNYTGFFKNTKQMSNNLTDALNAAKDIGCPSGEFNYSGVNCQIPFLFHSDTIGLLEYSDININYNYLGITNCTSPDLNFTLYDELNKTILTGDLEATFIIYGINYTFDITGQSSFGFCLTNNVTEAPEISAIIQYEATGHSIRNYYLINTTSILSNTTLNIPLYLLPTSDSTTFEVTVYDEAYNLQEGVIVKTQRYYIGNNSYETVDMGLTDTFGKTLTHLQLEDAFYKFIIERNNTILWSSTPIKPYCTSAPCSLVLVMSGEGAIDYEPFVNVSNFYYNLSWNASGTDLVKYEWAVTDGVARTGRLLVTKLAGTTTTTICNINTLSTAGTLICNLSTQKGFFRSYAYADGDLVDILNIQLGGLRGSFGVEGLFWTIILILTISAIGLAFDARIAIVLMILSLIAVYFLGFAILAPTSIAAIIVLAVVALYQMR